MENQSAFLPGYSLGVARLRGRLKSHTARSRRTCRQGLLCNVDDWTWCVRACKEEASCVVVIVSLPWRFLFSLSLSLSPAYYNLSVSRNSLYVRTWRVCELFTHIFKRRRRLSSLLLVCCLTFSLSFFWLTHSLTAENCSLAFVRSLAHS